jgi:acetyl esterase/lipase
MIPRTSGECAVILRAPAQLLFLIFLIVATASVSESQAVGNYQRPKSQEDWTTLSVKGLGLEAMPPMPGGKVERPDFTREYVRLQWRSGDPVDLWVILPHGVQKPHVILYLYGFPSDLSRFVNDDWCKGATENGFAAVGFVSALTGERYKDRPMKEWFVSELQESLGTTTHDVQMVLNYLEQRGDLNTERVGIYGQGSGASIAILAASVDSRIGVLDLLNPWGDWPVWLKQSPLIPENERPAYLRPEFLEKVSMLDPVQILPKFTTQVIRLQQVNDDRITPATAREQLAAAVPRGAQVLQSENWVAYRKAWQEKKLWGWGKEQLEPVSAAPSAKSGGADNDGGKP